jgi:predicted AlkP superfamily phosphohydrolase/phosphomutase
MRLLVVGLDGIDNSFWKRIDTLSLVDYHGELDTYYMSLPSWMCSLTGEEFDSRMNAEYFVSHRKYKKKMLWEYLHNFKQVYLNIPVTFPAERIKGSFVCGDWKTKYMDSNSVWPIETLEGLKSIGYTFADDFENAAVNSDWDYFFDLIIEKISMRTKAVKYLYEKDNPELMYFVYRSSDECLHQRLRLGEERIDKMHHMLACEIKEILEYIQPENVLYLSDHSINKNGYHGPDHPSTRWGTWALSTKFEHIPPLDNAHILDIFPTILEFFDVELPPVKGTSLIIPESDTENFMKRMKRLGYIA